MAQVWKVLSLRHQETLPSFRASSTSCSGGRSFLVPDAVASAPGVGVQHSSGRLLGDTPIKIAAGKGPAAPRGGECGHALSGKLLAFARTYTSLERESPQTSEAPPFPAVVRTADTDAILSRSAAGWGLLPRLRKRYALVV